MFAYVDLISGRDSHCVLQSLKLGISFSSAHGDRNIAHSIIIKSDMHFKI